MKNLNKYAIMCAESYNEPLPGESIGDETVRDVYCSDGVFACLTFEGTLIVRGSDTTEWNWRMWVRNISATDIFFRDGLHDGWMDAAKKIYQWLNKRYNWGYIFNTITGHSAGGGIVGCLRCGLGLPARTLTFGAPEYYKKNKINDNFFGIQNVHVEHDFTRKTILHKLGYRRPGMSIILNHKKCLRIPILRGILDHRPSVYVKLTEGM